MVVVVVVCERSAPASIHGGKEVEEKMVFPSGGTRGSPTCCRGERPFQPGLQAFYIVA